MLLLLCVNTLELIESFQKLEEKRKDSEIYFDGQIYDAYSKVLDIFKSAKMNCTPKFGQFKKRP